MEVLNHRPTILRGQALLVVTFALLAARAEVTSPAIAVSGSEPRTVGCDVGALEAAVAQGGHIRIACPESLSLRGPLLIGRDTHLEGAADGAVLDGGGKHRLIEVEPGIRLQLTRLTLTRGFHAGSTNGSPAQANALGGAMLLRSGASLVATACRFTGNSASGGVGFTPFPNSPFGTYSGGSAHGGALAASNARIELVDCRFDGNRALGTDSTAAPNVPAPFACGQGRGGGVYVRGGSFRIVRTVFEDNRAVGGAASRIAFGPAGPAEGGAVATEDLDEPCSFESCRFVQNLASGGNAARNNAAGSAVGGALHFPETTRGARLALSDCDFLQNRALPGLGWSAASDGSGGAVASFAILDCRRSLFVSNRVEGSTGISETIPGRGGAVANLGWASFEECTFRENVASGVPGAASQGRGSAASDGLGGALFASGTNLLNRCAFDANQAIGGAGLDIVPYLGAAGHGSGGAILVRGTLHATNGTFTGNLAAGGSGPLNPGNGRGGALAIDLGEFHGAFLTFTDNRVRAGSGLVWTGERMEPVKGAAAAATLDRAPQAAVQLRYSILAHSEGASHCDPSRPSSTTGTGNLTTDTSCNLGAAQARRVADARLARVDFDTGPSPTLALLSDSPALDRVPAADCPPTDLRSQTRPTGAPCDIGAHESTPGQWVEGRILVLPEDDATDVRVTTQPSSATARPTREGTFALPLPPEGSRRVIPGAEATTRFRPVSREIDASGPVGAALVFRAYPDNTLAVERDGRLPEVHVVYAGPAGVTVRMEASEDWVGWQGFGEALRTDADGLALWPLPPAASPDAARRFFRARRD